MYFTGHLLAEEVTGILVPYSVRTNPGSSTDPFDWQVWTMCFLAIVAVGIINRAFRQISGKHRLPLSNHLKLVFALPILIYEVLEVVLMYLYMLVISLETNKDQSDWQFRIFLSTTIEISEYVYRQNLLKQLILREKEVSLFQELNEFADLYEPGKIDMIIGISMKAQLNMVKLIFL